MKAYRLGLYEKSMPNTLSFKEKLNIAKNSGFDFIELSIDETDEKLKRLDFDMTTIKQMKADMDETGIYVQSICLSGHRRFPLGSLDQSASKRSLEIMQKAIILAHKLGVRYIQIAGYDTYYDISSDETKQMFLINLKKSVAYAATYGVILAFETMETSFMNTTEKAMYYVELINSPYLKVYPDIGNITNAFHANHQLVQNDLNRGRGSIVAAHLKETKPGLFRNLMFGQGHTNYEVCLTELINQGVRLFVGEFWYLDNNDWKENIERAYQFLSKNIESVMKNENT
jgi:predicted hexulose-6-phosphate isomerase